MTKMFVTISALFMMAACAPEADYDRAAREHPEGVPGREPELAG